MQTLKKQFEIILSIIAIGAMLSTAQAKEPFLIESELIFSNNYRRDDIEWNSEYLQDNRTWECSRAGNSSNDGDVLDASPRIGYAFSGLSIFFTSNLALNLDYSYQDWYTDEGRDTVYFEKGNKTRTLLNEVNWESHAIGIGFIFNF
jgi:hypothetical protein